MISTDHQRRISLERLQSFRSALRSVESAATDESPFLKKVRLRSLQSQIEQIELELQEYENLKSGSIDELEVDTVSSIPIALVKARVRRGLSQSALADNMGVKAQQVQRWESELYKKASFDTLAEVARVLDVKLSGKVSLARPVAVNANDLKGRLNELGLPQAVIEERIFPRDSTAVSYAEDLNSRLELLVGTNAVGVLAGRAHLPAPAMRFKLPSSAAQNRTRAYSAYVKALGEIAAKCVSAPIVELPKTSSRMHDFLFHGEYPSFRSALIRCWQSGIPVLALQDSVAFHGACLRSNGRCVIVLKQNSSSSWRWLIDLLHELYHASHEPPGDFTIIESDETSSEARESQDEKRATRFAVLCASKGRVDELTSEIASRSGNNIRKMKAATVAVSEQSNVPVGLLANLMAHRLAESGHDWWGAAQNLQPEEESPWKVARDIFAELSDMSLLSKHEQALLIQALETRHEPLNSQ